MTWADWLQSVANIITIATSLVSWRGFVGSALAIMAWAVINSGWRNVYNVLHLRLQMNRLRYEQFILINVIFPDNYLRLSPVSQDRATSAINRYVLSFLCILGTHFYKPEC